MRKILVIAALLIVSFGCETQSELEKLTYTTYYLRDDFKTYWYMTDVIESTIENNPERFIPTTKATFYEYDDNKVLLREHEYQFLDTPPFRAKDNASYVVVRVDARVDDIFSDWFFEVSVYLTPPFELKKGEENVFHITEKTKTSKTNPMK